MDELIIRSEIHAMQDDGGWGPIVGEVRAVLDSQGPRLEIWSPDMNRLLFSAPLEILAWQLALMEPKLAQFIRGDDDG